MPGGTRRKAKSDPTLRHARKSRVLIVDDHPLVRHGLSELLGREPDLEICGQTGDPAEASRLARWSRPDMAIIDLALKEGDGIELIKQLKTDTPTTKILVYSMHEETLYAERVLRAGAKGFVNKQEPPSTLLEAVHAVLKGKLHLSRVVMERMALEATQGTKQIGHAPEELLSDRELEIFRLIGGGMATADIAARLHRSVKTIETHRERIKRKLQIAKNTELIQRAVQSELEHK